MALTDWLKLDWLKEVLLKPHIIFAIALGGCLLLFLPATYLDYFGLTPFRDEYRKWIGLTTFVALVILVAKVGGFGWSWIQEVRWRRSFRAESIEHLNTLSPQEQLIILACLLYNRRTITLDIADEAASALREKGILESASIGKLVSGFPHTIPKHVWRHLLAKREELLPSDEEELNEIREIIEERLRL
jgi:hypothetical protein